MIKKVLVVIALAACAAILVYSYYGAIPLPSILQSAFTKAQSVWTTLPSTIRGLITLGIPSLFALFFAWTKTRAMEKLQETQLQASQAITQLEGEKGLLEQQVEQSAVTGVEGLVNARDEAQKLVTKKEQEILGYKQQLHDIQIRHLGEISSLQARLDKYEPKVKVVVK